MSFFRDGRVVVRVAANEFTNKDVNPSVPYGPEEIAADAAACADAGAAIVHVHSRHDDGSQALDDDSNGASLYRRAMELTGRASNILVEPTNIQRTNNPLAALDVPHVWSLRDIPPAGSKLEIVNLDAWRFGKAGWDTEHRRIKVSARKRSADGSTVTSDPDEAYELPEVIRQTLDSGLIPFFGVFELGDVRMLAAWARGGYVPRPVLMQINLFCDQVRGPTPGMSGLDALLEEWNAAHIDSEIFLFVRAMRDLRSYEELFLAALDRGVHPRVGLGDNPHLFKRNVDAVEHAVQMATTRGLTPATPNELRSRIGLKVTG